MLILVKEEAKTHDLALLVEVSSLCFLVKSSLQSGTRVVFFHVFGFPWCNFQDHSDIFLSVMKLWTKTKISKSNRKKVV